MTPQQVSLVQSSFNAAARRGAELLSSFYGRLFEDYPELRSLFPQDREDQGANLLQNLSYAVNNLTHPQALLPIMRDLGKSHRGFKVEAEHYTYATAALIGALRETLAEDFTHAVERAWVACYVMIAHEMEPEAMAA
ncbi:globin domain-containing protein [Thioclava sp. FR2]|uniref:globin domain-containing protein n=1 Tax=Thioclava sp. FR2 TaxID=3445780 RepID=UPI003EBC1AE4